MTAEKDDIDFSTVESLMDQAVREQVFPGAVLRVQRGRTALFHLPFGITSTQSGAPVTLETVFDLASLTKPLATTLALMLLAQDGKLTLDQPVGTILPALGDSEKAEIQIRQLLTHTAGLPAHRPYYEQLFSLPDETRRGRLNELLVSEPLAAQIGGAPVYSDIGFMLLRWVVETVSEMRLDRFVMEHIFKPLDISVLHFNSVAVEGGGKTYAPTQWCRWRKCFPEGVVGDENAFAAGGVDGHAGLFGTAAAVGDLLGELMAVYRGGADAGLFQRDWVRRFLSRDAASGRALGFDMPTPGGSSSGSFFSEETVGHLGYTGASFWSDLKRGLSVILLTNRVHPSTENTQIRMFRPKLHDAVMACILPTDDG